jgi:glutathione S-transferase
MITLYHCVSARSFRPLWTLEELNLSYELKMLPFPPRVQQKSYLEINPLGTVPTFFDDGMRMTESSAICQYLGTRHGDGILTVRPEEEDFGLFLNWVHFGEATLTFPQTLVLRYGRYEPDERKLPQVADDYTRWFLSRLKAINAVLVDREYLCASRFTVADVSVGYALMLADYIGLADRFPTAVTQYWQRLSTRQGFLSALERQQAAALEQGVPVTPAPCA